MNSRPILISHKDSGVQVITPKMILSPYLTSSQLQSWVLDTLEPLTALNTLASLVQKNHQAVLREGDDSKPDLHALHPQVDDVVLYKTRDSSRKFGIITAILDKNQCEIRTTFYGSVTNQTKHKRLLVLVHRKSEWNQLSGIPVSI